MYNFNFDDTMYHSTWCGAFVTLFLIFVVGVVTYGKFAQLTAADPSVFNIHTNTQYDYFDQTESFAGLKFALGLAYKEDFKEL